MKTDPSSGYMAKDLPPGVHRSTPMKRYIQYAYVIAVVFGKVIFAIFESIFMKFYKKQKSLQGKVCLVTGSGRGFGRELCLELAREGAIIACTDIDEQNNAITLKMVEELGAKAKAYKMNVASKKEVEDVIARIEDDLGPIYLLVNNAAIVIEMKNPTEEFIRTIYNVNVLGSMWTSSAVVPRMSSRNEGHIVFISSASAFYGVYIIKCYASTKAALTNYAQSLRIELMMNGSNIKISIIHPHTMKTFKEIINITNERIPSIVSVRSVVRRTMTAIKCEEDLNHPTIMFPLLPTRLIFRLCKYQFLSSNVPSEEEYSKTHCGEILKICSSNKTETL